MFRKADEFSKVEVTTGQTVRLDQAQDADGQIAVVSSVAGFGIGCAKVSKYDSWTVAELMSTLGGLVDVVVE